jgi:hypothetical protein
MQIKFLLFMDKNWITSLNVLGRKSLKLKTGDLSACDPQHHQNAAFS